MSKHYRRGDPESGLVWLGIIFVVLLILWAVAIKLGFWPYLLGFGLLAFLYLWVHEKWGLL